MTNFGPREDRVGHVHATRCSFLFVGLAVVDKLDIATRAFLRITGLRSSSGFEEQEARYAQIKIS